MNWKDVLHEVETISSAVLEAAVHGVQYDSRRVHPGDLFVAMRGGTADGNRFIDVAIAQGAKAVLTDSQEAYDKLRRDHVNVGAGLVEHGRRALAEASSAIFGHPQQHLALSGVTGTNGKTTTAFLLEAMLKNVGRSCVLIGTIETHIAGEVRESPHTTPESRDVLELFAEGIRAGATEAVMEMSSHALEQERVWGLPVDVAIFTNLTQDHLDFHGTMERYFAAKARLFEGVGAPPPRVAVVNIDDPYGSRLAESLERSQLVRYGLDPEADFRAEDVQIRAGETRFVLRTPAGSIPMQSSLTGRVNVYNLLAASAAAWARGLTLEEIARAASAGTQVPGRFEVVPSSNGVAVVVDYAHTDDALRNLIALARELVRDHNGRVITLFGCGGDRDRTKRPRMGRAAGEGSDLVVLTSDNPRSEDPEAIIAEALVGVKETGTECIVEEDRAAAIAKAVHAAREGDIVLIAGKGHEKVQMLKNGAIPFDDAAIAARVLKEIG
ncbi:UDP-N-acetylmuramoyl-L-alanyl-D-glutamate--2,6-diaminopimelate ligase [Edaphobacter albus]|uniref:UDP-N-acetylmuramoyl-L-alanyl-D-glutamate--2, 6-diaminopimelate ligase n=1 Tax=Edaphobacter sp. 4G125 TaxID=2763071 RepID=UPI001646F872|nr:UDP-N-acetylmuramoyl-L-alanyl-D-glutamate--2,6-diaminopimelate ligase [Edaphobacter sp. 4G125]QNI37838.1 UDP-N-acetylmuramoyl-L-alanyl-D-glutamate--2,6-diaminopimelate ligase [Edaphobacter sp. 4G125]